MQIAQDFFVPDILATYQPTPTAPTPNDIIEGMAGRRHLSWSQLSSFRGCPRNWFFSHVESAPPEFVASSLLFGSAFHTAVQHHYEQQLAGQATTLDLLHEVFHQAWQDELDQGKVTVRYGKSEDENSLHETSHRMLEAFLSSGLAHLLGVIAVEETVTGQIHPDMPALLARIDVVWQSNGQTHLMDLKTARSRWSAAKADESAD